MKKWLREWLSIPTDRTLRIEGLEKDLRDLQVELGRTQKFIGAIFDYLGVRPQRSFTQDFSRLPDEAIPTMEVIKVMKVKSGKRAKPH